MVSLKATGLDGGERTLRPGAVVVSLKAAGPGRAGMNLYDRLARFPQRHRFDGGAGTLRPERSW